MVYKIVVLFFLGGYKTLFAADRGLSFLWKEPHTIECQKRVEDFFSELRSMAGERVIELDLKEKKTENRRLELACVTEGVRLRGEGQEFVLRYLLKARGYAAVDWLPFQEHFLRPEIDPQPLVQDLAPKSIEPETIAERVEQVSAVEKVETKVEPIWKRKWIWVAATAVGAGIAAGVIYSLQREKQKGPNVEVQ